MTASVAGVPPRVARSLSESAAAIIGSPRSVQVLRVIWGLACFAAPAGLAKDLAHQVPDRRAVRVIRVLGVRHIVQGIVSALAPGGRVLAGGAVADGLHSASMLALGVVDPHRRRLAWTDGVIAAGWGILTLRGSRRASVSAD